ncbi:DUF805 domain-containing protein [Curtobacterium sp. Arg-1]|uniref:DUF805 domain-containing protein n=1 Tax=Curtobacterium sp. Arg-1 TaxID=2935040 RepID=UPI0021DAE513|nr:DUF805 domain-containing protein [Curtobacterium sp. Arg-1]UXZ56706.1 DUF805 domain-containing protein [Curtobacterium sp. Arg-1]
MTDSTQQWTPAEQTGQPTGAAGVPPRWAPWYGISFPKAIARFFAKYATFSGRASRSEFWWWFLANTIVTGALVTIGAVIRLTTLNARTVDYYGTAYQVVDPVPPIFWVVLVLLVLWGLATLVPSLALGWRRLHDANLSGALWIIALFIGVAGVVFGLLPSNPQGARYDRPDTSR